jgi:hypothetical protein
MVIEIYFFPINFQFILSSGDSLTQMKFVICECKTSVKAESIREQESIARNHGQLVVISKDELTAGN